MYTDEHTIHLAAVTAFLTAEWRSVDGFDVPGDCGVGVLHTRYAAGTKPELTRLNTCCAVDSLNLLQYVSRSPVSEMRRVKQAR